jgi:hypothetical protein
MDASAPPSVTRVDAGRLWAGGLATAVVAALVGLVGVLVASVADINPVSPEWLVGEAQGGKDGRNYALTAFLVALLATALLHVLLLTVPYPLRFFHWIVGLSTVAAVTVAFTRHGDVAEQVAAGTITAAIGIAIGSLLSGVAIWSVRDMRRPGSGEAGTGLA